MKAILKKELKRTRTGLLIWCSIIGIIILFGMMEYPMLSQYTNVITQALDLIPKTGQLIFGIYHADLTEAIGYFIVMYYWSGLIVFVHAIYTGASIIAKESRDKTAEFLFTMPYPRKTIIWVKIAAGFLNIVAVAAVTTLISVIAMLPITRIPAVYTQVLTACTGMFLTQCVLFSLGLLCSALFKTCRLGIIGAGTVLIVSYCLMFFIQYTENPALNFLSPLTFFGASEVTADGLRLPYILLSLLVMALSIFFTQKLYKQKELG